MSVNFEHPEYVANKDKWRRCTDVCAGQDAIYANGKLYLHPLKDQSSEEYDSYLTRAPFYNASWRTVVGLQGMLFRKPPKVVVPDLVVPMLENIDLQGTPAHIFALEVSEECLKIGRLGLFTDFPTIDLSSATTADALSSNLRPSMKMYKAVSIINWKTRTIDNETKLSMVVLKEAVAKSQDEFEDVDQIQYRVLDLIETDASLNTYRVRVFMLDEHGKDVLVGGPFFPIVGGKNLDSIPFQFIGVDDTSWKIDEPPLIDLFDMNISHFKTTADYEHGCHFTGLPTPVITGYEPATENEKFYIGSTTAWIFRNANAKASYLEFTGQGLSSLAANLTKKEGYMAILGARMLEVQVRGVESANTAAIHRGGEQSMLASVAQAISIGFTKALKTFVAFTGADTAAVKFELNRDFFPVPMDALTITAIIAGWQNAAYSYETMFDNLQQGDVIPLDHTPESEQAAIKANPPPLLNAPTTPGNVEASSPKASATPATPAPTITQLQNIPVTPASQNPVNG